MLGQRSSIRPEIPAWVANTAYEFIDETNYLQLVPASRNNFAFRAGI